MAYQSKKHRKFVASAVTAAVVASAVAPAAGFAAEAPKFKDEIPNWAVKSVDYLVGKKAIEGNPDGTFAPNANLTRAQAAKILALTLDLNVDDSAKSSFKDVSATHWAQPFIAAIQAQKKGVIDGDDKGNFNPEKPITRQELAKMVVTAYDFKLDESAILDFKDNTGWGKEFVNILASLGVVEGVADGKFDPNAKVTRAQAAAFVHRAEVPSERKDVKTSEVKITSANAINAKTLEVKFNSAVNTSKAKITVKRGTVSPTVKEIKFSEDKKSATVEFTTNMLAGDYTVTVEGLSEKALTSTVKVEAEKLSSIAFLSDIAVISGDNITTSVVAKNQYGETINTKINTSTNTNISGTTSKGSSVAINSNGVLTVTGSTGLFKVDDKVVVTIVDAQTGISTSKTLTVAKAAAVESIKVGEIKTDDKDLAAKTLNLANYTSNESKFYIPVEVKDQYGNVLKANDLNTALTVHSSNTKIIKPAGTKFVDTDNGTVLKFQASDATATHGTAVLTFVAASTGKTANTNVTIKENSKLDVVTLESASLIQNKASELPISITNTYGEEVNLYDVSVSGSGSGTLTLDGNTTITATNATLSIETDYINKKAKLKITPSGKNVTVQVVTATGKAQVLSLTAEDTPSVSAIKGLDKDFVSQLANDATLDTDLASAVEFVDQYGNDIAAPAFDAADSSAALDYTVLAKDASNTVTSLNNGVVTASSTAGTEVYEVVLKDANGNVLDKLDVTVGVVDADKLTEFRIGDLNKFYTGASSAAHNQTVEVFGIANGKDVVVNQSMIKDVYASNGLTGFTGASFAASAINTDNKDVTSTLTVLVANSKSTYTLTKEVTYNSAAPLAQKIVTKYDGKDVSAAVQVPFAELNKGFTPAAVSKSKLQFVAKDQYGVQVADNKYTFVTTNRTTAGTVSSAGVGSSFVSADAGKSLQLNVRVDGVSTSIKVIAQ